MAYIRLHPLKVPLLVLGICLGYLANQVTARWTPSVTTTSTRASIHGSLATLGQVSAIQDSTAQKSRDTSECYELAKAKTGIDPKGLGMSAPGGNADGKTAQSAAEALTQAGQSADPASEPAEKVAEKNPNQSKIDTFNAANHACMQARGYVSKSASVPAKPDEK